MNYKCAFCRNDGATKERKFKGDFITVMCDTCDTQYKEHSQLAPKFAYCLCNPDKPKEVEIGMVDAEIAALEQTHKIMTEIKKEVTVKEDEDKPYFTESTVKKPTRKSYKNVP